MKIVKNIIKIVIILFFLFTFFNLFGTVYSFIVPKIDIKNANSFSLYDINGKLIYYGSSTNDDNWVNLKDMGDLVVKATVSVEDKNFYKHNGFNYLRIFKALYENVKSGNIVQGASTITQQYAKNLFLPFDQTWKRKWQEMWITFSLEYNYTKDEIIEGYLNTINYGHGNYGISNAASYYFNKDVKNLSLAEISIIVGIPNSPSNYSPLSNYKLAKERQQIVLSRMYNNKYITKEEMEEAYNEELTFYGKKDEFNLTTLSYFKDAVMKELESINSIPDNYMETNGIKIYTTLDLEAQESLEKSITNNIVNEEIQTAKILMDTNNGAILGLIGGVNYEKSTFNRATDSIRQPGSTIKPFLYYKALENGFTASSTFLSSKTTFNFSDKDSYSPSNSGNIYANKEITMATAIAYSDNIYAVKTHLFLGEDELVNILKKVGITTTLEPIPSLPLGSNEINIIELTSAYATLANQGYRVNPHLITKVKTNDDKTIYNFKEEKEQILDSSLTFIVSELLTGSYDSNLIDYAYPTCINILSNLTNKYALKSGSTDTDAWVVGYNKDIVLTTWAGYDDNKKINSTIVASNKKSWATAMETYLKNKKSNWYTIPNDVVGVLVDPINGNIATEKSKNKKILYYIKNTEPNITNNLPLLE